MQELLSWSIEKITMYHVTEIAKGVKQVKKMGINFVRKCQIVLIVRLLS